MIWLFVVAVVFFGLGFYFHEKYWPKLQEVLRQVW